MTLWNQWVDAQLEEIKQQGRWRRLLVLDGAGPRFSLDGRPVVSFASNDYLGLSSHPQVRSAAARALRQSGAGAGSSRLIV
ncbi:MAG TPA: hypothetical protein VLX59_10850, partial [Acidimicrobiales bacterium]|nr:hypothetical protein [Acidimicrobiales bacterium]